METSNFGTKTSGRVQERDQEQRLAEMQSRIDKLESICYASKEVLTLEEAANFLGVKKSTLYKMTHLGQIPYYKPWGKMVYFEKSLLLEWVRQVKVKSEDEIREEAATHLSELCLTRSERNHQQ